MTDNIKLPPLPKGDIAADTCPVMWVHSNEQLQAYARASIEADRKRRQLDAEEVCAEAYQVVGSLLSDLGIFETHYAEKILDNLSQAKMVHDDVLPWPSFDRKRRGETVYLYRRKGRDEFVTCDKSRYDELSSKPDHFETKVLYTAPQPAEPVHATLNLRLFDRTLEEMMERIAALLYEETTGKPWTVADVEGYRFDRAYYRRLAHKVAVLASHRKQGGPQ